MKIFGIFGDPIEHSLSPAMQNAAFRSLGLDACYHAFRVTREKLEEAIRCAASLGFAGLNLTIPLKEKALELDILQPDKLAMDIGAVNTISFRDDGQKDSGKHIFGHNTDGWGAIQALKDLGVHVNGSQVLLIGAGGAARAIAYTLAEEGAEVAIANRNIKRAHELAANVGGLGYCLCDLDKLVPNADIIINATSVGMREEDVSLFEGRLIQSRHAIFDIVYNRETELLKDARASGAIAIDGVMMLVYQGAKALEMWTGKKAPVHVMEKAVRLGLAERLAKK
jgi:shikimate dehydrogenase